MGLSDSGHHLHEYPLTDLSHQSALISPIERLLQITATVNVSHGSIENAQVRINFQ